MNSPTPQEAEIFAAALEIESPDRRAVYLDSVCGADAELRDRIEALLRRHEESRGPLDAPRPGVAPTMPFPALTEGPGTVIGPYKLLEQIGEGGMGVVYMAEQTQPVARRVALKIIKPGLDTRQVIARFEAERQALAMMDHPNIAKVLDAGATDSGRPYFVMELVKGVPITQFCDAGHLTATARLELFLAVCHAVQHAHQKGVIHRDLKPSNILVALYDDRPVPKVIDFGVAKATGERLTEKTMFTQFGQIVGTLEYMSPEQAKLNQWDVDTRSDIYSLGVLLYELLTGTTPFEKEQLRGVGFDELLRIIRETEPPRPSVRLSTSDALPSIAANRSVDPKKLGQLLRGDLDWIVMKALAKDRTRRYGTAAEFAADVSRHLSDEPVLAGPPSVAYRTAKFLRKHRRPVAVALMLLTVLLVGFAVSLSLYFRAERLRQDADRARADLADRSDELQRAYAHVKEEQRKTGRAYDDLQAEQQRTRQSLENERRTAYFNRIALAYNEWQLNNVPRADRLLDECPADLRQWEWNYLKRLSNSELLTLGGFKDMVRDAVFSPDGRYLATTDLDGKVKVWDARSGEEVLTFRRHLQIPSCVAFSPDGTRIVSASALPEIGGRRGHGFQDLLGMMLGMRGGGGEVLVWEALTGKALLTFGTEHKGVRNAAFSPDGTSIATTSDDKSIRLWNAETGEPVWSIPDANPFGRLAFSPNGEHIAVGRLVEEKRGEVTIRNAADGELVAVLKEQTHPPVSVAYSPDGKWLASASADEIVVWDAGQRTERFRLRVATGLFGNVAAFTTDSRRLAVACMEQKVRFWDVQSGAELPPLRGHTDWVTSIAIDPQGKRLAATAGNFFPSWFVGEEQVGEVKVWDISHPQDARTFPGHTAAVNAVAFSPLGNFIASGAEDNTVRIWNAADGSTVHTLEGHSKAVTCVAVSPDGTLVASGGEDKTVHVWDAATGRLQFTLEGHRTGLTSVAFHPAGDRLATAGSDDVVKIWNTATGEELLTLLGASRDAARLAFSPDGKLLVRACKGSSYTAIVQGAVETSVKIPGEVRVWNAVTGEKHSILPDVNGWVQAMAFSRSGRLLAVAEQDVVKLYDVETWRVVKTLRGEAGEIKGLAFGRNDERLAAATEKAVKIWDLASAREAITVDGGARSLAFDADGWLLATASDNDVRIWDGSPYEPSQPAAPSSETVSPPSALDVVEFPQPVREFLDKATESLKHGDLTGSLLHSVAALKNDDDPSRAVIHRTRIGLLLQNLPQLGGKSPQIPKTPVIPKPSEGLYDCVLGPHARWLAANMWNVPATPEEEAEEKRTGRPLNRYLLQVFDVQTGRPIGPQRRSTRPFMDDGIALSADGRKLALLQFRDDDKQNAYEIRTYDLESGEAVSPPFDFEQRTGSVFQLDMSPDGRWVVMNRAPSQLDNHMLVWDAETGKRLELDEPFNVVYFSPDGRLLLSGWNQRASKRLNTVAQVWDARTWKRIGRPLDVRLIDRAVFSGNGRTVAIGDGVDIKSFDVETGRPLGQAIHVGSSSFHMALAPQGRRLAVGRGKTLQVWDVVDSQPIADKVMLPADCRGVEFTPDGLFLVTSSGEYKQASAQVWDAMTGDPVSPPLACYASYGEVPFRLSRDGKTLFTFPVGNGSQSLKETEINARLSIWPLRANDDSIEGLQQLAELHSGHAIDASGQARALSLDEYRQRWQTLRSQRPNQFAGGAPDVPTKLPAVAEPREEKPPARTADYVALLRERGVELKPPLSPIVEALTDPSEQIRKATIRELQTAKIPDDVRLRLLAEALYDRTLTSPAAEAIGKLGPEAAPVVPQLVDYLDHTGPNEAIVWALGRIGPQAADALPALQRGIKSKSLSIRVQAMRALPRVDPKDTSVVPDLIENLNDFPQPSEVAAKALERITLEAPDEVAPLLIDYMKKFANPWGSSEVRARNYVADLLGKLGPKAGDAIPVLERSLNRRRSISEDCRAAEAAAYWRVGGDVKLAVTKLAAALKQRSSRWEWGPSDHERAATALAEIGPDAADAVPPLRKLLESKDPAERLAAACALWRITGEIGASVSVLVTLLESDGANVKKSLQARALGVLGEIGPPAKDAVPFIVEAIRKEDAENAARNYQFTEIYRDEEDQPPDETTLLRDAGVLALRKIDPEAAKTVESSSQPAAAESD